MRSFIARNGRVLTKRASLPSSFIHSPPNTKPHRVTYQPWRVLSSKSTGKMKRKAMDSGTDSKAKRPREPEADYCDVISRKDGHGNAIWPASEESIQRAGQFLTEW